MTELTSNKFHYRIIKKSDGFQPQFRSLKGCEWNDLGIAIDKLQDAIEKLKRNFEDDNQEYEIIDFKL